MAEPTVVRTSRPLSVTSRLRVGLGTFIAIEAEAHRAEIGELALRTAFEAINRVDLLLHPARHGSDLAAINAGAPGVRIAVHAWTWEVLELAQRLHRESGGIFDPCLPASTGTLAELELVPRVAAAQAAGTATFSVIPHAHLLLDLGGIGKGFAVDRGIEALRNAGCRGGLVNAGGDLAVFGARDRTLLCCDAGGAATRVILRNAALAASDVTGEARPLEHRGYYDGRDGRPITAGRVAVTAPNAATADALTKCLLADSESNRGLLDAFDARRVEW